MSDKKICYKVSFGRIHITRFLVIYHKKREEGTFDPRKSDMEEVKLYATNEEERDALIKEVGAKGFEPEIIELDQSEYDYLEKLDFPNDEEAKYCMSIGLEEYKKQQYEANTVLQFSQYMTEMEYRVSLLEWGVK